MKITKSQLKQIIKEELDAAMLDAYIDNPTDFSMPEEVAFHPEMIKARTKFFREKAIVCKDQYDGKKGKTASENPIENPELLDSQWAEIEDSEEKRKELNRIISQLDTMMQDQDFEALKQNPKFKELNTRMKELIDGLQDSRGAERAAGRQIARQVHNWVRSMMNELPSDECIMTLGGSYKRGADVAVPRAMEIWKYQYEIKRRGQPGGDHGRPRRDKQSRDRGEQRHQDTLRRMQRDQEIQNMQQNRSSAGALSRVRAGMRENKTKITKSQLRQIIKEELTNILIESESDYLSNIYKWCPAGAKCSPDRVKTKWWKGR